MDRRVARVIKEATLFVGDSSRSQVKLGISAISANKTNDVILLILKTEFLMQHK